MDASEADFHDTSPASLCFGQPFFASDATVDENGEVGDPTETALWSGWARSYGFDEADYPWASGPG